MASLIERQIDDWQKRGVIDAVLADTLRKDAGVEVQYGDSKTRKTGSAFKTARRFSFFQVLIIFAAISFTAGVALLIAANWELIPRLLRAVGILALVATGLLGGVYVHGRFGPKSKYAEESCYLIAGGAFLSAVALVAQMYHISGDVRSASLLYALCLGFGAMAVRSLVLTGGALFFWVMWHIDGPFATHLLSLPFWIYYASLCAALLLALILESLWAKRMIWIAMIAGLLPLAADIGWWVLEGIIDGLEWFFELPDGVRVAVWSVILAGAIAGLFMPDVKRQQGAGYWRRNLAGVSFFAGCCALLALHEFADDDAVAFILAAAVIIFVLITLYRHGKAHQLLRYCCYGIFLAEVFYLYAETISSMISTSGFLILMAVFLVVVATVVYRLEKRFAAAGKMERTAL